MTMSSQFHVPAALFPVKELPASIEYEAGCFPEPVWTFWRREESLIVPENEPCFVQVVAQVPY